LREFLIFMSNCISYEIGRSSNCSQILTDSYQRGSVRLKNNVINAEISDNIIKNCGIHDYEFESDDKNGEGIYIGTSSKQVSLANT